MVAVTRVCLVATMGAWTYGRVEKKRRHTGQTQMIDQQGRQVDLIHQEKTANKQFRIIYGEESDNQDGFTIQRTTALNR